MMRALVARPDSVTLEDRAVPAPGPGEVAVRTTAASMCSADVATAAGHFDVVAAEEPVDTSSRGIVLGHEAVGRVYAMGPGVTGFEIGQRVAGASTTPCGHCTNCQRGYSGHCQGVMWGGYTAGVSRDGSLAEYFVVPHANLNLAPIPEQLSDSGALFVTDTLASGSSGIVSSSLPLGGVVAVFGQGHIGLGATATARLQGAGLVIAVKARPGGEDRARALGADVVLNHAEHDVRGEIHRLTEGAGVDLSVEASGAPSAFSLAVEMTRLGGEVSVLATYTDGGIPELTLPLEHWGWGVGDKKVLSTFQRSGSEHITRLMRLVARGRIDPTPLFTHEYDFQDIERAFDELRSGSAGVVKPLIRFSEA
jgi:isopropanol dehydrogenase (NADP+)